MDKDRMIARWEAHLGSELVDRDVDATMNTMTPTPYVNHVPTMTGGVGAAELRRFYKHHFIPVHPADFEIAPVSRTVHPAPGVAGSPSALNRGSAADLLL
jgi:carboxymethylenebutenolidase